MAEPRDVPADCVTMNSEAVYEDCSTSATRKVRIVYPRDADARNGPVWPGLDQMAILRHSVGKVRIYELGE